MAPVVITSDGSIAGNEGRSDVIVRLGHQYEFTEADQ